jgi:restriction system protein
MDWKDYQKKAALFFETLGCNTEIESLIQGARAKHEVDVLVQFRRFGINSKWIIECKYWNVRVTKEKVLALISIVDDIGADRGVLISKMGFQSGAVLAAKRTNIHLTTLEELQETA